MRRPSLLRALAVAAVALAGAAPSARAQTPGPIPAQTYNPAPPGEPLFTAPSPFTPGHLVPSAGLDLSYAYDVMALEQNGSPIAGTQLVRNQFWGFAQGSLGLWSFLRLDVTVPVALYQNGSQGVASVPVISASGFGDLRLGAQALLARAGPVGFALGLDVWLPTGSRPAYASDGNVSALPKLVVGGEAGPIVFGTQLGVFLAQKLDVGYAATGSGFSFAAGAAYRLGDFRVGPEAWGQIGFNGTRSPVEALVGGHWNPKPFDVGLAVATGLDRAPGAAPIRVILTGAWRLEPEPKPAAAPPPPAAPATPPPAVAAAPVPPPAPAPPPAAAPAVVAPPFTLRESFVFELDQASLKQADVRRLDAVAEAIKGHPDAGTVRVDGYTDTTGPKAYNQGLSLRRAEAVRKALVEKGVPESRLVVKGHGAADPVAPNTTRQGREANRRAVVVVGEPAAR